MGRGITVFVVAVLSGCVLYNPGFNDTDAGSESGDATTTMTVTGPTTSPTSPTTDTESGSASETGTTSAGTSTGGGSSTTGLTASASATSDGSSTGTTDETDGGSSTGNMNQVTCSEEESKTIVLLPTENTYVVTGEGKSCEWIDSNEDPVNLEHPCGVLNFGSVEARYTTIGQDEGSRGEYLVRFGVHQAMDENPEWELAEATLQIVPWWFQTRADVVFDVGIVDPTDMWTPGDKKAMPAKMGDSNWYSQRIEGMGIPWASGDGPSAGSVLAATIELDSLTGGEHPEVTSTPIPGAMLSPWVADAKVENGLVLSTEIKPILVKNKDTPYPPKLILRLCPK